MKLLLNFWNQTNIQELLLMTYFTD